MVDRRDRLELWGGVECTVTRIGNSRRDQIVETGHWERPGDIDRIADLGISTIRFPILWERVAPDGLDQLDFAWTDARLARARELGLTVIAGLVHHGSGPAYTDLLDPDFAAKLAEFAGRVADRYPWIDHWSPVNEPLTTARFSGLYGHWYPHLKEYPAFLRMLVNQCRGVVDAMATVRAVVPGAKLVQTEDLGRTFSTAPLRQQAAHDNERRWLSLDLLCGRVDPGHPMRRFLLDAGIGEEVLESFEAAAGTPDLVGINHYLTSDRFLDDRLELYPPEASGGNGRDAYVDAEAVRVSRLSEETGLAPRLREAWQRYGLPLAVTEVHHGCTRDEQLRWFAEAWRTAQALRDEGVDLRAVTLWALFGNVDWRSLLTRREGLYDSGAFDVRGPEPRPTVIAQAARHYAAGRRFDHPVLDSPGWWRRPPRLYPWNGHCKPMDWGGRKLLITGATGTLGQAFARICEERALPFCLTDRDELDICDRAAIAEAIERHRPWAIINTAGFVRVGDAERERAACFEWNAEGPARLAEACAPAGIGLVTFSSDLVFDGGLDRPYREDDPVNPSCAYGQSKAEAERRVLQAHAQALVVRTAAFFGAWDRYNFVRQAADRMARGEPVRACPGTFVSPTFVPDLCHAVLDLLIDGERGIWHLANDGRISWHALGVAVADRLGFDPALVVAAPSDVPRSTVLTSARGHMMRPLATALESCLSEIADAMREAEAVVAA